MLNIIMHSMMNGSMHGSMMSGMGWGMMLLWLPFVILVFAILILTVMALLKYLRNSE